MEMQRLILELDTKTARFEESVRKATERLDDFVDAAKEAEMYGLCVDAAMHDDSNDDTFGDVAPIEPGDVVMLITGGPAMTVLSYCDECGDVEVAWFDKDDALHIQLFPEEALT